MTLGERIRKLRKEKDLTQQDFCNKIGLKRNSISLVESGKRNISDQAIKSICREFNVNERWLRTGEGEMFVKPATFSLDQYAKDRGASDLELSIAKAYFDLPPDVRNTMLAKLKELLNSADESTAETQSGPPAAGQSQLAELAGKPVPEQDGDGRTSEIESQVERYRQQLLLEARMRTSEESTPAKTG